MARRQSTSNTRARRNRAGSRAGGKRSGLPAGQFHADDTFPSESSRLTHSSDALVHALQAERGRLSHARSVLACLHVALLHSDDVRVRDPDYATAVGIALALVREAADNLDSARLPVPGAVVASRSSGNPSQRRS